MTDTRLHLESFEVADEAEMTALGKDIAAKLAGSCILTLVGDLGTGKSVLARSIIQALGHRGSVKSPTYTLVETYELEHWRIAHLDLYRLNDPEELHFLGFDDIVANSNLLIIEWPDKGAGLLPKPTHEVTIEYHAKGRLVVVAS